MRAHPQSEEWKAADTEIKKLDELRLKRIKHDRHDAADARIVHRARCFGSGDGIDLEILVKPQRMSFCRGLPTTIQPADFKSWNPDLLKAFDDRNVTRVARVD